MVKINKGEIDFFQAQKKAAGFGGKLVKRWLTKVSFILVIIYLLVAGFVFSFLVYGRGEYNRVSRQITAQKQQLTKLTKIESLQLVLKQELSVLSQFLAKKRPNHSQLLSYFEKVSPIGITIKQIEIGEKGETKLDGMAENALVLGEFLDNLKSATVKSPFLNVALSSASRQSTGVYQFSVSALINEKL